MSVYGRYAADHNLRFLVYVLCMLPCLQIAGEMRATELQRFRDTVWGDSLMIILVFYEILTSKADVEDIMKLRGTKAQFMLDLMQDVFKTSYMWLPHILTNFFTGNPNSYRFSTSPSRRCSTHTGCPEKFFDGPDRARASPSC
jgi:hypothetical protein